MNRIQEQFQKLRGTGKIAFMPFIVAGDPDFETSVEITRVLAKSADFLEIGFPYSDPLADGPTIQASDERALKAGINTRRAFEFIKEVRKFTKLPITLLVYANLVYQWGVEKFYEDAKIAGIDGVLIPDVPIEEAKPYLKAAQRQNISPIFLVAQTTTNERLKNIILYAQGYLYLVSVLGVTGERKQFKKDTLNFIERVRAETKLPLAVGFGISTSQQVHLVKEAGADGFIIGSALISIIEKNLKEKGRLLKELSRYVDELMS